MPTRHVCKQNDHISKVADQYGYRNWQTVWDANKDRLSRSSPNTLYKGRTRAGNGDYLDIPDPSTLPASGGVDAHHPFTVGTDTLQLRVRVFKDDMTPLKNAPYELRVAGIPTTYTGNTTDEGLIEHELRAGSATAVLTVQMSAEDSDATASTSGAPASTTPASTPAPRRGAVPVTWHLEIGGLNPIKESAPDEFCISGVQQRMNNIGLNTGPIDGLLGPNTRAAIGAFQRMYGLLGQPGVEEGVPDVSQTQTKLYDFHDGPTPPALPGAAASSSSNGSTPSGGNTSGTPSGASPATNSRGQTPPPVPPRPARTPP